MWKLNQLIAGDDEEKGESFLDDESEGLCSLSPTQVLIECMHLPRVWSLVWLVCFCTAFLIGPVQQLSMMFDSGRVYATSIYIGFVVISLICALWIHSKILTVIAIICEICALIWYSLSYIPFARSMVSNLMVRFCDTEL
ncbi:vesicle transport protein SFT2A isoform X2 [Jatropha curcas]|uniref:vesicle transport protein SFT2A isoform X2 n=1 Tax=Jatropha curcas TaxID=180498 RepID=UPI0009D735FE|nr:vesicle transport protein SFT2A isoform X2 [Jatropha curcas]